MNQTTRNQTPRSRSRLEAIVRQEWTLYLFSAVLTGIATTWALRLWQANWTVPIHYGTDAILGAAGFKTVVETGWYETQPLLGAPHGQVFHDWKIADNFGYLYAKLAAVFTSNPNVILNVYFVLGFLLASVAALWFFRLVGVSRALSVGLSVLYAIAPYHFLRGENHLYLAAYYPIPLAMGVVYLAMRGQPLWTRRAGQTGWRAWLGGRWLFTTLALAVVASANSYYAVFTVLFIALAGLVTLIRTRDWRGFLGAVIAGVFTVIVMVINMLPDMIFTWANGSNPEAVARVPFAIEVYSLKLAQLILPMQGHRIGFFDDIREYYVLNFPPQGESPVLGLVGAFGFLALLGVGLYFAVGLGRRRGRVIESELRLRLGALSALTIFGFLLATTGGFSSILGYLTSDLRAWNRISIVLALFALAAVGLIVDAGLRRIAQRHSMRPIARRVLASAVALTLLGVGYLDQVGPGTSPDYRKTEALYQQDEKLVKSIEDAVGADASIVQLPYRDFPESPAVNGVADTDQIKLYLHSSTLSWTGGGIKGRPYSEWVQTLQGFPAAELTQSAAAAGFEGILVDRQSYGDTADEFVSGLRGELGDPEVTSEDARYEFYSLAPALLAVDQRFSADEVDFIGNSIANPVLARVEPDVRTSFNGLDLIKPYDPRILLENPRTTGVALEVVYAVQTNITPRTLRFTTPDGTYVDARVRPGGKTVTIPVVAAPGRSYIDISVVAGEPFPDQIRQQTTLVTDSLTTRDVDLESLLGLN